MKLTEEVMSRIGINVECRNFVEAIFRDNLRIADLPKHRGKGAYAFNPRKLNNACFMMPMHVKLLSNMVHLMSWEWLAGICEYQRTCANIGASWLGQCWLLHEQNISCSSAGQYSRFKSWVSEIVKKISRKKTYCGFPPMRDSSQQEQGWRVMSLLGC